MVKVKLYPKTSATHLTKDKMSDEENVGTEYAVYTVYIQ